VPAKYVRPYSKGLKERLSRRGSNRQAVQRPTMKFVATKTADEFDLQALHRVRERLVNQRTGIINQIRAFLLERGVAVRQGLRFLRIDKAWPGIAGARGGTAPVRGAPRQAQAGTKAMFVTAVIWSITTSSGCAPPHHSSGPQH
jgi:transposase